MPTNRKRLARHRIAKPMLDPETRSYLLTGFWFGRNQPSQDELKHLWLEHRDDLLTFWLQDPDTYREPPGADFFHEPPGGPGTRPFAWWRWSAPAPRKVIRPNHADEFETEFTHLARRKLFTAGERKYFAQFPAISARAWVRLQRHDWHTAALRHRWLAESCRHLTPEGEAWRGRVLADFARLGITLNHGEREND